MHGFSPRDFSLTARQLQTSAAVSIALPELPTSLSDLVSQMAVPDFSPATQMLELSSDGVILQNHSNLQIISSIELALTASSSDCDPAIKATIFVNASKESRTGIKIVPYLAQIINTLKLKGLQIILDDVVLNNMDMNLATDMDLSGMSARGTTFDKIDMPCLKMDSVDFTGARFIDTSLRWANISKSIITDAWFFNVEFHGTEASELTGNQSGIFDCGSTDRNMLVQDDVTYQFDDVILHGENVNAFPDMKSFIFPERKNMIPYVLER